MPAMALTAEYVSLNNIDRSAITNKIELSVEVDEKDVTTFASGGWKTVIGGLKNGSLSLKFIQDIADAELDESMWTLLSAVVPFEVRLSNAAVSSSNPKYSGTVLIKGWKPIAGSIGDVAEVEFPTSGPIVRAEA
jgi:predicted secreted protein